MDEIGQIIFQLSDISDLAFATGSAMTTNIEREGWIFGSPECFGHWVHARAGSRRTMNEDNAALARYRSRRRIRSVGQLRSIARSELSERRQIRKIHRAKWIVDAFHRVRRSRATEGD